MTISGPSPLSEQILAPTRARARDRNGAPRRPSVTQLPEAARSSPDLASTSGRRLAYIPALDGLRGVAVLAVLAFHSGFSWAVGGYLGVSTFFTLSGFLITSLLLAERRTTSTVDLRAFWGRRLRRLMPASLATLAFVLVYGAVAGSASQQRSLFGGVGSALGDASNWYFVFSHTSYADLFSAPSPVLHFWSLSIEEQFYVVFPVLTFLLMARLGLRRRGFGAVIAALMAGSVAATLMLGFSTDRIYFGTDTRAFELLAGCLLAVAVSGRPRIHAALTSIRPVSMLMGAAGVAAALAAGFMWVTTGQTTDWLYGGGLQVYALFSVVMIMIAAMGTGPLPRLLRTRPLVELGLISYGVYLYHWPVFLWIDQARTGLDPWPLFGLRVSVTLALAIASYHLLERPVRERRVTLRGHSPLLLAPAIAVLVGLGAWTIAATAPPPLIDFAAAQRILDNLNTPGQPTVTSPPTSRTTPGAPPRPARVAAFGDSTAVVVGAGIAAVDQQSGLVQEVKGGASLGCGLGRGGLVRVVGNPSINGPTNPLCDAWGTSYKGVLDRSQPDLALMLVGPWDVADRKLPGDNQWRSFGDPIYDRFFESEMLAAIDLLSSQGAQVVWLTSPPVRAHPERTDRMNTLIRQLPTQRPGKVVVIDLAADIASRPNPAALRPDGIHLGVDAARQVANDFLIPRLGSIWAELYAQRVRTGGTER